MCQEDISSRDILEQGSSAVRLYNQPSLNSLPDQMAGHSGGRVVVGQTVGGTLRGPGPDQAIQSGYNIVRKVVHTLRTVLANITVLPLMSAWHKKTV